MSHDKISKQGVHIWESEPSMDVRVGQPLDGGSDTPTGLGYHLHIYPFPPSLLLSRALSLSSHLTLCWLFLFTP